jgi:3-dehydroquinate dehydratase/shikimate dehydrogenase
MHPLEGRNPVEHYTFTGHEIAYDLIYNPPKTAFLAEAENAGCVIINGEQMLFEQAKKQFSAFTGERYPE